jgi:hypothetical protein
VAGVCDLRISHDPSFVNGALRELSVGLCRGNFLSYRASVGCWLGQVGQPGSSQASMPAVECVEQYCVVFACDVLFVGFALFFKGSDALV